MQQPYGLIQASTAAWAGQDRAEPLLIMGQMGQVEGILIEIRGLSKWLDVHNPSELIQSISLLQARLTSAPSCTLPVASQLERDTISLLLYETLTQLATSYRTEATASAVICRLLLLLAEKKFFLTAGLVKALEQIIATTNASNSRGVFSMLEQVLLAWDSSVDDVTLLSPLVPRLWSACFEELHAPSPKRRQSALSLLWQVSLRTNTAQTEMQAILTEFSRDPDSRVRTTALLGFLSLMESPSPLEQPRLLAVYNCTLPLLADDFEEVRIPAVQLIQRVALRCPDAVRGTRAREQKVLTLLDDAFMRLCYAINDIRDAVKLSALECLASFAGVSEDILLHSLDKTFSNLMQTVADTLNMRGFVSAFVQALDDECAEVRLRALLTVSQIAKKNANFATSALDLIVDMFSDEIQSVRLEAIRCLGSFSTNVTLRDEQLDVVLYNLEENSQFIREAIHRLLGSCALPTGSAILSVVNSLLANLTKYPLDVYSIWRCVKGIGSHNGHAVCSQVSGLLRAHPFFISNEPNPEDPAYISILILVFNAISSCPTVLPILPTHIYVRYPYLRDALPQLVPPIRLAVYNTASASREQVDLSLSFVQQYRYVLSTIEYATPLLLKTHAGDFFSLTHTVSGLSPVAAFASFSLYSLSLLSEAAELLSGHLTTPVPIITKAVLALKYVQRLQYLFTGLSEREAAVFSQWGEVAWGLLARAQQMGAAKRACLDTISCDISRLEVPPSNLLRISTVKIFEPKPNESESPLKYAPGLAFSLTVNAVVTNCTDTACIAVTVRMPDDKLITHKPRPDEFSQLGEQDYRVLTSIVLDGKKWSGLGQIELNVVYKYESELGTEYNLAELETEVVNVTTMDNFVKRDSLKHSCICLSQPVSLFIKSK